jgi:hypothetical protein
MRRTTTIAWSLLILVILASLYRIIPGRPPGFAPQWAIALFCGALVKDRRWALAMPVVSMFISDLLYQLLFQAGYSSIPGFYTGQWENYGLFILLTVMSFRIRQIRFGRIAWACIWLPSVYFLLSNLILWSGWSGTRGLGRPKTPAGLVQCYVDALPFYAMSLLATALFSALLFGSWLLLLKKNERALPA